MKIEAIEWDSVLGKPIQLETLLNVLPTKGNLVYEYNPFRNYRLTENKYWYQGAYHTKEDLEKFLELRDNTTWL